MFFPISITWMAQNSSTGIETEWFNRNIHIEFKFPLGLMRNFENELRPLFNNLLGTDGVYV